MGLTRFLYSLLYSLSRLGKKRVSDEEFARDLEFTLTAIIPRVEIHNQAGITHDGRNPDELNLEWAMATYTYVVLARNMFDRLKSFRPQRRHMGLHKSALFTLDSYTRALKAWANYEYLISGAVEIHRKDWLRELENAKLGDKMTYQAVTRLITDIESSSLDLEIPGGLKSIVSLWDFQSLTGVDL